MTDDELRALLEQAHSGQTPPPFDAMLGRARAGARAHRPRPRRMWLAGVVVAAAVAVLMAFVLRPRPRPATARLDTAYRAPLDFLLDVPGTDLLRDTPRFDLKGTLP